MFTFIADNLATILIGLVVLAAVALIIVSMVKKKRRGQTIGCSCGGCSESSAHDKHC